jgi:hypothetical protein
MFPTMPCLSANRGFVRWIAALVASSPGRAARVTGTCGLRCAHKANKLTWDALITSAAPDEDEEEEPPAYDPEEFEERHSHYTSAGGEGSQDEYRLLQ